MLLRGLPLDSRTRNDDPDAPLWGYTEELIAQVLEEVSVIASDHRRKKPRQVPRPGAKTDPASTREKALATANTAGPNVIRGHKAMLAAYAARVGVDLNAAAGGAGV